MAKFGGNKFGGGKFGGGKFGGKTFGGNKFGASAKEAAPAKKAAKGPGPGGAMGPMMGMKSKPGHAPGGAMGSMDMDEMPPMPTRKPAAPAKVVAKAASPKKGGGGDFNSRKELGDMYLSATSSMFSPKAGGSKGKKIT